MSLNYYPHLTTELNVCKGLFSSYEEGIVLYKVTLALKDLQCTIKTCKFIICKQRELIVDIKCDGFIQRLVYY